MIRSRSFGRLPRDREICLYSSVNRDSTERVHRSGRIGIGIGIGIGKRTSERLRTDENIEICLYSSVWRDFAMIEALRTLADPSIPILLFVEISACSLRKKI